MKHIDTACGCSKGRIRTKNEDNFFFNGEYLPAENNGLSSILMFQGKTKDGICFAVFDGMGGERCGELAAHAAAWQMKEFLRTSNGRHDIPNMLGELIVSLNAAVLEKAREELTRHMGTTLAGLFLREDRAYAFNLGDSRVYLSRDSTLTQLSVDHVDQRTVFSKNVKPSLTQHLGIDEEEFVVEPSITCCNPVAGDRFLLCSDGLTDMLADQEIGSLLQSSKTVQEAVESLIATALDRGGRDNVTIIVCEIK